MSLARVTFWDNLRAVKTGKPERTLWPTLFGRWEKPGQFLGQDEHPGWSPAEFDPCERALCHVQRVSALCLDYDGTASLDAAQGIWGAFLGFVHTTRKHTPESHRFRVVLPFKRPVSPFEFEILWRKVNAHAGGKLDPSPKDPSRFWFVPGVPDSGHYETRRLNGELFDPDEWLRKPEPTEPKPAAEIRTPRPSADDDHARRYALSALEREVDEVKTTPEGGRNTRLNVAAFSLGQLIGAGALHDSEVRDALRSAARACGLGQSETEATIASGIGAGRKEPRRIPEPTRARQPEPPDWDPEPPVVSGFEDPIGREPGDDTEEIAAEQAQPERDGRTAIERYGFISMVDLMQSVVDELQKERPKQGARTGHYEIDNAIGGFRPGNVTVFGAKRGFGKTSYGNMVVDMAMPDLNVAMFAGEDAAAIYGKRFLAMRARINAMLLRDYRVNREDWPKIMGALAAAPPNPFFVRVEGRPVEWIAQCIRDVSREQRIDLVVVDYLQCIRAQRKTQDRRNEVTYVCKTLGDAIKGANAAGLIFSQLKRTERIEPEVEDLKESGDIEDMAEHILLGWKVESQNAPTSRWIKLAKNKDGIESSEVSPVQMKWNNTTASFEENTGVAYGDDAFAEF